MIANIQPFCLQPERALYGRHENIQNNGASPMSMHIDHQLVNKRKHSIGIITDVASGILFRPNVKRTTYNFSTAVKLKT